MHSSSKSGFTLVELAIVIVIIGLIVAGVTSGQLLVKQSQVRAILTQADQVRASATAFKLKYNGLPGDITNASSYWTTGCRANGVIGSASVDADCNGDGNKQILVAAGTTGEMHMAWYHMGRAGVFPGTYVPTNAAVGIINGNIPSAKYSGVGVSLGYDADVMLSTSHSTTRNIIAFGKVATTVANGAFLTPAEASSLDEKADDGNPLAGIILGGATNAGVLNDGAGNPDCGDAGTGYALSELTTTCSIGFTL